LAGSGWYHLVKINTRSDILNILDVPALETLFLTGKSVPASAISAMILRSGCHLLPHMLSVFDFDVPSVVLDSQEMHEIASGLRLPLLRHFSCSLHLLNSFPLFLAVLERGRVQGTPSEGTRAVTPLHKATGYYYIQSFGAEFASTIHRTNERIGQLNEEYGTEFELWPKLGIKRLAVCDGFPPHE